MTKSESQGHNIEYVNDEWIFSDTRKPIFHNRECKYCGKKPEIFFVDGKPRDIDSCIYPIIKALNEDGIKTIACCCGHGKQFGNIALADGRELFIIPDYETARKYEKVRNET